MSTVVKDLGAVSAYAYAVEKGYTGTEAEFAELMADYADVGQRAEDAANSASESKSAAQTAATTATNKASEATTAAQTATTKAGEATTAAGTATTAKNDAVAAKTAAETAQGKAEDAQEAAESVAESIPSDYSQLSEDVSDLKEDLEHTKEIITEPLLTFIDYNDKLLNSYMRTPSIGSAIDIQSSNKYYLQKYSVAAGERYEATFEAYSTTGTYICVTDLNGIIVGVYGVAPERKRNAVMLTIPTNGKYMYVASYKVTDSDTKVGIKVYKITTNVKQDTDFVPVADFIQGYYNNNGSLISDSVIRITQPNILALPYGGKTRITVTYEGDFICLVRAGKSYNALTSRYWFMSGTPIEFNDNDNYFVLSFTTATVTPDSGMHSTSPGSDISPSDMANANVRIKFDTKDTKYDVKRAYASSVKYQSSGGNLPNGLPFILHISDIHGDFYRVRRFLGIADDVMADAAVLSGDFVANNREASDYNFEWLHDEIANHATLPVICTGNHDLKFNSAVEYTDADIYTDLYAPVASKLNNETGKSWYSTDISAKNIRMISVNLYQDGGTTRNKTHFTDEQLSWLCDALKSTPSGYGIIIVLHAPQTAPSIASQYTTFWQADRKYTGEATYSEVTGDPIADVVDAFISRAAISKTYNQTGNPSTVTVSDDFSEVGDTVEFIAYMCGHLHQDSVYYVPNRDNLQLVLNVTCAVPMYGGTRYPYLADCSDLVRNAHDETMDAINAYGIDRTNKKVRVARIGADATYKLTYRDWMEIPYAT